MRIFLKMLIALVLATTSGSSIAAETENLEESVCGSIKEPLAFWMWSGAAGKPDPETTKRFPNAEPLEHKTRDGRILRGYKLKSTLPGAAVVGSVLVAQGNAMLADQLLSSLEAFSKVGIEVYVFDYRGYGRSEVGFVVPTQGSKAYTQFVKSELDGWTKVIATGGIKPE